MILKFECIACGQRISATEDLFGTNANCPSCGFGLVVPRPDSPKAFKPIVSAERVGATFAPPPWASRDLERQLFLLDKYHSEIEHLEAMIERMKLSESIREPSTPELYEIQARLFQALSDGVWKGTDDELKEIVFTAAPNIRNVSQTHPPYEQ
jgi:hypothetical protein